MSVGNETFGTRCFEVECCIPDQEIVRLYPKELDLSFYCQPGSLCVASALHCFL